MITNTLLTTHIIAGITALLTGYTSLLSKKGSPIHVKSGRIYMWAMLLVVTTAFPISVLRPNPFLFCIAIFSGYLTYVGVRSVIQKSCFIKGVDYWVSGTMFATSILAYTTIFLLPYGQTLPEGFATISLVFASIACLLSSSELFLSKWVWGKSSYLEKHNSFINGALLSTTTAVLVTLNARLGLPNIVIWLGPTILVTPLIFYHNFKLKRR
ncbi:hypothetical protein DID77_00750 [Candidatus Marinamargulisbacteria bacterium SCGC AG-439-L15]|nr:hypothetical protein DID77_00750 [Candidatus Marinamargulisbacteria bacterium SCGC AG-439-L15]